ncbi:MAG: PilZ domain-containing protein [Bdellovibrio sp.]
MKTKPWSLIIISLLHVLAPLGNLFINAMRSNRTLLQQWQYWIYFLPKPFVAVYLVVPVMAGIFIYLCRRWSYWAYLACVAAIFLVNIYGYYTSMHWETFIAMLMFLTVDLLLVAYFIVPSVQTVYMNPNIRWWEAAPRYNFNQDGTANGEKVFVKNLSQGGLFVTSAPRLKTGDHVECSWSFEGEDCKITGTVIYQITQAAGAGVRFEHTPETQKQIKTIVDKLHSRGAIVVERLPGPEDRFYVWFKRLVTTGEGLFPKFK